MAFLIENRHFSDVENGTNESCRREIVGNIAKKGKII
jgi:hypothetical protein